MLPVHADESGERPPLRSPGRLEVEQRPCSAGVPACEFQHRPGARNGRAGDSNHSLWRQDAARTRRRGRLRYVTLARAETCFHTHHRPVARRNAQIRPISCARTRDSMATSTADRRSPGFSMMTLRQLAAEPLTLPTRTTWYLADLSEARGKQELFTRQSPQKLRVLREHALIDPTLAARSSGKMGSSAPSRHRAQSRFPLHPSFP